jgi:hypothetical protein
MTEAREKRALDPLVTDVEGTTQLLGNRNRRYAYELIQSGEIESYIEERTNRRRIIIDSIRRYVRRQHQQGRDRKYVPKSLQRATDAHRRESTPVDENTIIFSTELGRG